MAMDKTNFLLAVIILFQFLTWAQNSRVINLAQRKWEYLYGRCREYIKRLVKGLL